MPAELLIDSMDLCSQTVDSGGNLDILSIPLNKYWGRSSHVSQCVATDSDASLNRYLFVDNSIL